MVKRVKVIMNENDLFINGCVDDEVLSMIKRIRYVYEEFHK